MAKKFLKTVVTLGAIGVASKAAYDKYVNVKQTFEKEENESLGSEVKKYNAIFQNKIVEVDDEEFTGCEVKAIGSKTVIDLGLAVFEKDAYINFSSKASSVTIVLPEGVNVELDIDSRASVIKNAVRNTNEDGIHTVYVIGSADCSHVQITPVDFYVEDEGDFEDVEDSDAEKDSEDNASENDDLENMEDDDATEDLEKLDGAIEVTVEEV